MWHPLEYIPVGWTRWVVFAVLLVANTFVMFKVTEPFRGKDYRAVDLEFAMNKTNAEKVIESLGSENIKKHLCWDNLFILIYSMATAIACILAAASVGKRFAAAESFYLLLAWCAWVAGVFDWIENFAMYKMLDGISSDTLPQIAWWAASFKFLLIGSCIFFVLVEFLISCYQALSGIIKGNS